MEMRKRLLNSNRVLDLTNEKGFLCGKIRADWSVALGVILAHRATSQKSILFCEGHFCPNCIMYISLIEQSRI